MTDESLFAAALALPAAERPAYLDAHCPDPAVRKQVEDLLAAADGSNPLDRRPVDVEQTISRTQSPPEPSASVGDRVGPYKLLEKIGEGGMGEVWVADQQEPIKRRVALKLIKPGMDTRSVLGRFEAERQALAVMDHPNIAKVLDAGTTSDGRPYFVMELVKGTPITEFADARKLTPKQRLELFVPVCQAIQHAHMKGIIHRDIKPSNVLVALHDETPVPKVIDFGVAKAVGQQLTEKTIYTGFGALVGTPTYMAPEQATFNQLDVDTRADVYALGVLLYELLAGSPPIEKDRLKKAALDEVLRIVRDEEPPRPSQRLSTAETRASIAALRGTEPEKLSSLMKGELDWIVMKALEKDRTRRYETANGFAADVQRYLSGEQVQAVPPSLGYRLAKAYRKNKAAVSVAAAFTGLIIGAAVMGFVLAVQARRAEAKAEDKRREAEENRNAWEKANGAYLGLAIEAEIRSNSARIDADLLEYKSDTRIGLLRLARPLKDSVGPLPLVVPNVESGTTTQEFPNHPDLLKLREFQAAAVIAAGQEFVPLVPPLGEGGAREVFPATSPDGRLYIVGDGSTGLKLLAIPSRTYVGTLREGTERVLRFGFSPDGKTAWTQDTDSVVRFWNTDGTLRAKTPVRSERFVYPAGMTYEQLREAFRTEHRTNACLVADGVAVLRTEHTEWEWHTPKPGANPEVHRKPGTGSSVGPADLYCTRTGQLIRRLDRKGYSTSEIRLEARGRWLIYQELLLGGADQVVDRAIVIVSTDDGRQVARLDHPGPELSLEYVVSPSGKWVLTYRHDGLNDEGKVPTPNIRLWNPADWKCVEDPALSAAKDPRGRPDRRSVAHPTFVTDDVVQLWTPDGFDGHSEGVFRLGRPGPLVLLQTLGLAAPGWENLVGELGGRYLRCGRVLSDATTFQLLKPPVGRRYATELAKLAPDGRFWEGLDTVTEKELPNTNDPFDNVIPRDHFPGLGCVAPVYDARSDWHELRILPDASKLAVPPAMLELWAQVVTGGELTPEGTFHRWDQPTWAAKQKQLAAMTPPSADLPFPGWVATEPHHWHLLTAHAMPQGQAREERLTEWRRLTGRTRPMPEADLWRTKEPLPPPRADK